FLDLSRMETGQLEIRREPVDVERVARRMLEELSPQAQERGLWLRLAPVSGPVLALGDEGRIAQIFTNLVHNGLEFTERRGGEVGVSSREPPVASRQSPLTPAERGTTFYFTLPTAPRVRDGSGRMIDGPRQSLPVSDD